MKIRINIDYELFMMVERKLAKKGARIKQIEILCGDRYVGFLSNYLLD